MIKNRILYIFYAMLKLHILNHYILYNGSLSSYNITNRKRYTQISAWMYKITTDVCLR
jgi:hypothetical protein